MNSLIVGNLPNNVALTEQSAMNPSLFGAPEASIIGSDFNFEQLLSGLSGFILSESNPNSEVKPELNQQNYNLYSSLTSLNEDSDIPTDTQSLINHSFFQSSLDLPQNVVSLVNSKFDIEKNFNFEGFIFEPKELITPLNLGKPAKQISPNSQIDERDSLAILTPMVEEEKDNELKLNEGLNNNYNEAKILSSKINNLPLKENIILTKQTVISDEKEEHFFEEDNISPYPSVSKREEDPQYIIAPNPLFLGETPAPVIVDVEDLKINTESDLITSENKKFKSSHEEDRDQKQPGLESKSLPEIQPSKESRLNNQIQINPAAEVLNGFDQGITENTDTDENNYQYSLSGITPRVGKYSSKPLDELKSTTLPDYSHVAEQVSMRINKAISSGETRIQVELSPEELGKIEISLQIDAMGNKKIEILSDKFTTFDILQSSVKELELSLSALSGGNDGTSLNFGLRDHHQQHRDRERQESFYEVEGEQQDSFESSELKFSVSTANDEDNINILV